jgi:hypothetical protein
MVCRSWSQWDGMQASGRCSMGLLPETSNPTKSCIICATPIRVTAGCGGACWDGVPPAGITVNLGAFISADGTDLSRYLGEQSLHRVAASEFDGCCQYVGKSSGMLPFIDDFGLPTENVVPVEDQQPDMTAAICDGGSGWFRIRIAGSPIGSWDDVTIFRPSGFLFDLFPGDRPHRCTSPWTLSRVGPYPFSGPGSEFVGQVTPPSSVGLRWRYSDAM